MNRARANATVRRLAMPALAFACAKRDAIAASFVDLAEHMDVARATALLTPHHINPED